MEILELFQYEEKLKFSDIEKSLKVRSNKLAYHLKNLTKRGILEKEGDFYKLSESSEHIIPYVSEKKSLLPVILILIGNNKKAFLYKRKKRPYLNLLSLPGGRMLIGESLKDACVRIMNEKFDLSVKFSKLNSVSFEQVSKSGKIVHSFILFFVTAKTSEDLELTDIQSNRSKIISSDYKLITGDYKKNTQIKTINSSI